MVDYAKLKITNWVTLIVRGNDDSLVLTYTWKTCCRLEPMRCGCHPPGSVQMHSNISGR